MKHTTGVSVTKITPDQSWSVHLQDGMLQFFLEQAKLSDANVEQRLEREPFDVNAMLNPCRKEKSK